jgi:hypothetical protein
MDFGNLLSTDLIHIPNMMNNASIKEKIVKAVKDFNKYTAPESKARLVSLSDGSFKIEFTGPFCRTCGFHDYFDDFKILLEEIGLGTKIAEIKEMDEGAAVKFELI